VDVSSLQYIDRPTDPFYLSDTFRQYVREAGSYYASTSSFGPYMGNATDGTNISVGYKYSYFLDPGAVWERTDEPVTYEINGEYYQSNLKRADNAINWSIFQHISYNASTQIGVDIDYAVSVYQTYKKYIQDTFTGEERDEYMAKLHELIAQAMKDIANGYADEMGSFLEKYGVKGEHNALKESIFALFEERLMAKSGVSLDDFGIATSEHKSKSLYSIDDIFALGFMQEATFAATGTTPVFTREDYPAGFLSYAMKKESIYEVFSVSDSARDKIETVFFKRIGDIIDERNDSYAKELQHLRGLYGHVTEEQLARYAPFDKEHILQIVNNVLENMNSGLSAMDALKKTDYFQAFFTRTEAVGFLSGYASLADIFDEFLTNVGRIRQLKNIDWTKSMNLVA